MAIDWTKPVETFDGKVPLLSPPNENGWRLGYIGLQGFQFSPDGTTHTLTICEHRPQYDLRNKPETIKVWLRCHKRKDGSICAEDISKATQFSSLGPYEWLHGPIEIPVPEGK